MTDLGKKIIQGKLANPDDIVTFRYTSELNVHIAGKKINTKTAIQNTTNCRILFFIFFPE